MEGGSSPDLETSSGQAQTLDDLYELDALKFYIRALVKSTIDEKRNRAREIVKEGVEMDDALDKPMLKSREREVLKLRFGLEDGNIKTLAEVRRELKIPTTRLLRIQDRALGELWWHRARPTLGQKELDVIGSIVNYWKQRNLWMNREIANPPTKPKLW